MPATLDQLGAIRSRLAEEMIAYLEALAADAAALPKYYPSHLRAPDRGETGFDHIRQAVQFVDDRSVLECWRAEERERMRAAGQEPERLRYLPERTRPEMEDSERWRAGKEPRRRTLRWDERAGGRFRRAVILGDTGVGKTWLLRYEARRLARRAADELRNHRISLRDLWVPIFARLAQIKRRAGTFENVLVELAQERFPSAAPSERFSQFVRETFETGRAVVLLDAWDEVPGNRQPLADQLARFARRFPQTRILLASRIVSYGGSPLPDAQELELLAFDWRQIETFVRAWFGPDATSASAFLAAVRNSPQLRGLARIPLMLALMCGSWGTRSYGGAPDRSAALPTRRVELYERCLRGLLRDWKIEDKQREDLSVTVAYVDAVLEVLAPIAYELFVEGHEEFSESLLRSKMRPWLGRLPREHELCGTSPARVIQRLKQDGILITTVDSTLAGSGDARLIFLHRTFHEYLAASGLAQRTDWLEVAKAHVYDPAWQEILRLLGGVLEDRAVLYVRALLRENAQDVLCRPFLLAVLAAAEASPELLPEHLSQGLLEQSIAFYFDPPWWLHWTQTVPFVTAWGKGAVTPVLRWLHDEDWAVREEAADALGYVGSPEALPALLKCLEDTEERVREAAARVLGFLGSPEAIPSLLRRLEDVNEQVREWTVRALAAIKSPEAAPALLGSLEDSDFQVSLAAAVALRDIGSAKAEPTLLRRLEDADPKVRRTAAHALRAFDSRETVQALLRRLDDSDDLVRRTAAWALDDIGSMEAMPTLLRRLENADAQIRSTSAWSLGAINKPEAVGPLVSLLENPDVFDVRYSAVVALGAIGSSEAVPALLRQLGDTHPWIRRVAAGALGRIHSLDALPPLIRLLDDADEGVRQEAAGALESIGAPECVPGLLRRLEDPEVRVREAAARALGTIRALEATPFLIERLEDAEGNMRDAAARALGAIGAAEATSSLFRRLDDTTLASHSDGSFHYVAEAAAVALTQTTGRNAAVAVPEAPTRVRSWSQSLSQKLERLTHTLQT